MLMSHSKLSNGAEAAREDQGTGVTKGPSSGTIWWGSNSNEVMQDLAVSSGKILAQVGSSYSKDKFF